MDQFLSPRPSPEQLAQTLRELERCNSVSGHYGLMLSEKQMLNLTKHRFQVLADTGRVEFGEGILKKLIFAFCPSPYLSQAGFEDTLLELQELFYHFKNESDEQLPDDDLIEAMRAMFDGPAQGSVEYLAGTALEEFCRAVRNRGLTKDAEYEEDTDDEYD